MECSTQDKEINNCKALCRCTGTQALSLYFQLTNQKKEKEFQIVNCLLGIDQTFKQSVKEKSSYT